MARKSGKAIRQVNVRLSDEDVKNLEICQQLLGGLSQADTIRQLVLMYLGKIPIFGLGRISGMGKITGLGQINLPIPVLKKGAKQ